MEKTLLAFVVLILAVSPGYACKPELPSQRQAFKKATSVFVGEVVDITDSNFQPIKGKRYFVKVRFKVIQYWKGRGGLEVEVHSEQGVLSCNLFRFQKGDKYLVYAYGKHLVVFTGSSRSAPLSWDGYVNDELRILGKGKQPKSDLIHATTWHSWLQHGNTTLMAAWCVSQPCATTLTPPVETSRHKVSCSTPTLADGWCNQEKAMVGS
jgi:hypothetical protein